MWARHRHTDAHNCVPIPTGEPTTDKKSEAQALLTKLFPNVKSQAGTSRPAATKATDPAKAAKLRAIELMRMKHRAVAGDPRSSAQPKDKVHLKVMWGTNERVVWFVKVRDEIEVFVYVLIPSACLDGGNRARGGPCGANLWCISRRRTRGKSSRVGC
jgi:hypothetical protein